MLTSEDIKNLTGYQKDFFVTKEEFSNLDKKIDKLQNSVDSIVTHTQTNTQQILVLNHKMEKAEGWIDEASPKQGISYDR